MSGITVGWGYSERCGQCGWSYRKGYAQCGVTVRGVASVGGASKRCGQCGDGVIVRGMVSGVGLQ